jgi:hypothetical protein
MVGLMLMMMLMADLMSMIVFYGRITVDAGVDGTGATALVGVLGASSRTFRTVWAIPVIAIYPLSILAVWGFDKLFT